MRSFAPGSMGSAGASSSPLMHVSCLGNTPECCACMDIAPGICPAEVHVGIIEGIDCTWLNQYHVMFQYK